MDNIAALNQICIAISQGKGNQEIQNDKPSLTVFATYITTATYPEGARLTATTYIKTYVSNVALYEGMNPQDKETLKSYIIKMLFNTEKKIASTLIEIILKLLGKDTINVFYPELLPNLLEAFKSNQEMHHFISLTAMKKLFKKYRYDFPTQESINELKYILQHVNTFLGQTKSYVDQLCTVTPQRKPMICSLLSNSLNIFQSISSVDYAEEVEDTIVHWLGVLKAVFSITKQCQLDEHILKVACAALRVITLFFEKYGDDIKTYIPEFYVIVSELIVKVKSDSEMDKFASLFMKFYTVCIYKQSLHQSIQEKIGQLIDVLVYPNVIIKDEDIEMFETNPDLFYNNDLEEADQETRRRNSLNLIRQLSFSYDILSSIQVLINNELQKFALNTSKWQHKVNALYIIIGGYALQYSASTGAISVKIESQAFINLCQMHVFPEIDVKDDKEIINKMPYLKCAVMKFLFVFRNQIPTDYISLIICRLTCFLSSKCPLVAKYAATVIDKLMYLKDDFKQLKVKEQVISSFLPNILMALTTFLNSGKNSIGVKILYRCILLCPNSISKFAPQLMQVLIGLLLSNSKSPDDSTYNYYLYETLALLIKSTSNNTALHNYSAQIQTIMSTIIQENKQDLIFYAFQIHALYLSLSPTPSDAHKTIMGSLLQSKANWNATMKYLIPSMILFIRAYMHKQHAELQNKDIAIIVDTFTTLLLTLKMDEYAFPLAQTLVCLYPISSFADFFRQILTIACQRIQIDKNARNCSPTSFSKAFLYFLANAIIAYGYDNVKKIADTIQSNLLTMILKSQIEALGNIEGKTKVRRCIYVYMMIACQKEIAGDIDLWVKLMKGLIVVASGGNFRVEEEMIEDSLERMQYQQLANAIVKEPSIQIDEESEYILFANGLQKISTLNGINAYDFIYSKLDKQTRRKLEDVRILYENQLKAKPTK